MTRDFGPPLWETKRRSVSHPCTTRSVGVRVLWSSSKSAICRLSIRLISFLGKPVRAATFERLIRPFLSRERSAAALTKASRASLENLFGVMLCGRSADASSTSSCCKSFFPLAGNPGLSSRRPRREPALAISEARANFSAEATERLSKSGGETLALQQGMDVRRSGGKMESRISGAFVQKCRGNLRLWIRYSLEPYAKWPT